jgi:hypothetical protein
MPLPRQQTDANLLERMNEWTDKFETYIDLAENYYGNDTKLGDSSLPGTCNACVLSAKRPVLKITPK